MWSRTVCVFVLLPYFVAFGASRAQTPPAAKQQSAPKPQTETFWHKVLRVSGIAESPSTLKGPGDEVEHGQIWVAEIAAGGTRKLTDSGGFRSPVFMPGGKDILALKGTYVVRVSFPSGKVTNLYAVTGIRKLVGFSRDDPDQVLALVTAHDSPGQLGVAFLSVSGGKLDPLSYDPLSSEDRHMLEHLSAWDRDYDETRVYINQQTKSGMAGTLSWTDVFLKKGSNAPIDVSNCDGTNCGQPSLSPDGKLLAFVRADEE
jgi:hypothetical protein